MKGSIIPPLYLESRLESQLQVPKIQDRNRRTPRTEGLRRIFHLRLQPLAMLHLSRHFLETRLKDSKPQNLGLDSVWSARQTLQNGQLSVVRNACLRNCPAL